MLINALKAAGRQFGENLYFWYGNLLSLTSVGHDSGSWSCQAALPGALRRPVWQLAGYGRDPHQPSLPEPLLAWEFMHLSPSERANTHLDEYKSQFYITATRLMRATALSIATSASTPLQAQVQGGRPVVVLTEFDSVRKPDISKPAFPGSSGSLPLL